MYTGVAEGHPEDSVEQIRRQLRDLAAPGVATRSSPCSCQGMWSRRNPLLYRWWCVAIMLSVEPVMCTVCCKCAQMNPQVSELLDLRSAITCQISICGRGKTCHGGSKVCS